MATVYNSKFVTVSYGTLPLLGVADGDFCTTTALGTGAEVTVGAQGHAVVTDDNNEAIEVTVRLVATGDGRNSLSSLIAHHTQGNPYLPLQIISIDTGEAIVGGAAKIKRKPDAAFGTGAPVREIVFVVPEPKYQVGPEV